MFIVAVCALIRRRPSHKQYAAMCVCVCVRLCACVCFRVACGIRLDCWSCVCVICCCVVLAVLALMWSHIFANVHKHRTSPPVTRCARGRWIGLHRCSAASGAALLNFAWFIVNLQELIYYINCKGWWNRHEYDVWAWIVWCWNQRLKHSVQFFASDLDKSVS